MPNNKHLDLTDRTTIETELDKGSSFKTIALALDKDPSTISKEVKLHLTIETVGGFRRKYNACVNRFSCEKRMICRICNASRHFKFCKNCGLCNAFCSDFVAYDCPRLNKPPYVCNGCKSRPGCTLKKHLYHAGIANRAIVDIDWIESEEITVGGLDNVDASVFDGFDYVALGHIHGPQDIEPEWIRYCGTPLKYSFSESGQVKSVTMVDMGEKGDVKVRLVPLEPVKELTQIRGNFDEVASSKYYAGTTLQDDYLKVVLTDEDDIPDAMGKLRMIYHNIVKMEYDNTRTRHRAEIEAEEDVESKSPIMLFGELFEQQNGQPMTEEQQAYIAGLIEEIWEDER